MKATQIEEYAEQVARKFIKGGNIGKPSDKFVEHCMNDNECIPRPGTLRRVAALAAVKVELARIIASWSK